MLNYTGGTLMVSHSTITGNTAGVDGGGIKNFRFQISRIRPTSCGLCYSGCSIRDCLQGKGANHPGSTNCAIALLSFVQYLRALGPPHRQCASGLELSTGSSCVREFQGTGPMER